MRVFAFIVILAGAALALAATKEAQLRSVERAAAQLTGGHPARGRELIVRLGCVACHAVPGVPGVNAQVGPPLGGFAQRNFVAGVIESTPDNVRQFIRDPRSLAPRSAMPKLNLDESDARDLTAFLYTLR